MAQGGCVLRQFQRQRAEAEEEAGDKGVMAVGMEVEEAAGASSSGDMEVVEGGVGGREGGMDVSGGEMEDVAAGQGKWTVECAVGGKRRGRRGA